MIACVMETNVPFTCFSTVQLWQHAGNSRGTLSSYTLYDVSVTTTLRLAFQCSLEDIRLMGDTDLSSHRTLSSVRGLFIGVEVRHGAPVPTHTPTEWTKGFT